MANDTLTPKTPRPPNNGPPPKVPNKIYVKLIVMVDAKLRKEILSNYIDGKFVPYWRDEGKKYKEDTTEGKREIETYVKECSINDSSIRYTNDLHQIPNRHKTFLTCS